MSEAKTEKLPKVGALEKRRVKMADGRRYLIYYTFENEILINGSTENNFPENEAQNSATKEKSNV